MGYRRAWLALAAVAVAFAAASPLLEMQECPPAVVANVEDTADDRRPRLKQYELAFTDYPAYGVPSADGHPNYVERATHAWHNLIRTAHAHFVTDYMVSSMKSGDTSSSNVFATTYYTAKAPVLWDYNLNRLARAHSLDRTTTCPGASTPSPHSDCNASTTCETCTMSQRFQRWYTPVTTYGEIYFEWFRSTSISDMQWPFLAAGGWICEGPLYSSCAFSGCVVDEASGHSHDGHRYSMMSMDGRVGHGYAEVADNQFASTGNMVAGSDVSPYTSVGLVSGVHTFVPPVSASTEYFYIASYRGTTTPSSAQVVIDGSPVSMTLAYGSSSVGGFTYKTAGFPLSGESACKSYYFLINGQRYPATGHFLTYGIGSCTADWAADSGQTCQCTSGTCCDGCNYRASSYACRAAVDACDIAEYCTGTSVTCPTDQKATNGSSCTGSTCSNGNNKCINGVCTCVPNPQTCQCTSGACCDGCNYRANSYVCRASAGDCDVAEYCTGSSSTCPADTLRPSTYTCRAAAGDCDVAELCTGTSSACPANTFRPSTYSCRAAAGVCDVAEYCTGSSGTCPTDTLRPSTYACRAAADTCDAVEYCTGTSSACPADQKAANGTSCSGVTCSNGSDKCIRGVCTCVPTPVACECTTGACCDGCHYRTSTYACSSATDACDVAAYCTGASSTCPTNAFRPTTYVCRAAAGSCDVAEYCTGTTSACPADNKAANGTSCSGVTCTNGSDKCLNGVCTCVPTPVVCECTTGTCCDGCHYRASTYTCRAAADVCDVAEYCTGSSSACPADSFRPSTYACRAAASTCDVAEYCTGATVACPADQKAVNGTSCSGTTCTNGNNKCVAGVCTCVRDCKCTSGACCDGCFFRPSTYKCRSASGGCDIAEYCTGTSTLCPLDKKAPNGTSCSGVSCTNGNTVCVGGVCTCVATATCKCTSGACCDGCNFRPSSYVCRTAANDCDEAEHCSGSSSVCPTDVKQPNGTACNTGSCSNGNDKCINGACTCIPTPQTCECTSGACCDGCNYRSSTYVCRAAADACDKAERCTGLSSLCPVDQVATNGTACSGLSSCDDGLEQCFGGECTCVARGGTQCECTSGECCDGCHFLGNTFECRPATGPCDVAELCTGTSSECPVDQTESDGTRCSGVDCTAGHDECELGVCKCKADTPEDGAVSVVARGLPVAAAAAAAILLL